MLQKTLLVVGDDKTPTVILPKRKNHKVPRLLLADAYTEGSDEFESPEAREKSTYYIVFRRELYKINPDLYDKGDNRIVFCGLPRILEELFYEPVTHEEIDLAKEYLATFKVTTKGLKPYSFPEQIWRDVVDNFNGRPPIEIKAMPEGSVVYPGEPVIAITSMVPGMGILGAWFEDILLQTWATSERVTQNEHWFKKLCSMVRTVDPTLTDEQVEFYASTMLHDFGARAAICSEETNILGMYHLLTFPGTDSTAGGFMAWMNSNKAVGLSLSVKALAHRNVQAYDKEGDCYKAIYNAAEPGDIVSMVADCYDYFHAVEHELLPLAVRSLKEGTGIVVVARPDSGDPLAQVIWTIRLAVKHGLYEERVINGKTWKFGTFLKFLEGDGMDFKTMWSIISAMIEEGFAPFGWGLFGVGGGLRNALKRDNTGAKYALCAVGKDSKGVVKLSETLGKTTLPGPFKVLRSIDALATKQTVVHISEPGEDTMVSYYNGLNIYKPFGDAQDENFLDAKKRVRAQMKPGAMPLNLDTTHGAPASTLLLNMRKELIKKYAPNKDLNNY